MELASDRWIQRFGIEGVPIVHVYPGLPAAKAGMEGARQVGRREIKLGDVITHINDKEIRSSDDYLTVLENFEPGDTVTVKTRRGDEKLSFKVKLTESQ